MPATNKINLKADERHFHERKELALLRGERDALGRDRKLLAQQHLAVVDLCDQAELAQLVQHSGREGQLADVKNNILARDSTRLSIIEGTVLLEVPEKANKNSLQKMIKYSLTTYWIHKDLLFHFSRGSAGEEKADISFKLLSNDDR